jgi:excisionase family DNA binding protein
MERLYRTGDVARLLGVSTQTVRDMVRRGALTAVLYPGTTHWRYRPDEVHALLAGAPLHTTHRGEATAARAALAEVSGGGTPA